MPVYTYRGTNRAGSAVSGEATATSKAELQNILRRQQITATKMSEKGKEFNLPTFGGSVKAKELAVFTRQFSVMIDAGLPLVQCLEILAGQQENKLFQKVLTGTRSAVEGGATLSAAMRQFPKVFDTLYVNMVEAGETGGILDTILQRLSQVHRKERQAAARCEVRVGLSGWRFDRCRGRHHSSALEGGSDFRNLFAGLGVTLPLPTRIVIGAEQFRRKLFSDSPILVGVVAAIFGIKIWYGTPQGRYIIDATLLKAPAHRHLAAENCGGALYTHARHAYRQRRSYLEGLDITAKTAGNAVVEKALLKVRKALEEGKSLTEPLARNRSFSGHGYADDRRRRTNRRDGCHAAENCGFL